MAEENREGKEMNVEEQEHDEVHQEDADPEGGQIRPISTTKDQERESSEPECKYVRCEMVRRHDRGSHHDKHELSAVLGPDLHGLAQEQEREQRESEKDRAETLLDRLIEQDGGGPEVQEDGDRRGPRSEKPSAY